MKPTKPTIKMRKRNPSLYNSHTHSHSVSYPSSFSPHSHADLQSNNTLTHSFFLSGTVKHTLSHTPTHSHTHTSTETHTMSSQSTPAVPLFVSSVRDQMMILLLQRKVFRHTHTHIHTLSHTQEQTKNKFLSLSLQHT